MKVRFGSDTRCPCVWIQREPYGPIEYISTFAHDVTTKADAYTAERVGRGLGFDEDRRVGVVERRADTTLYRDIVGRRGPGRGRRSTD